jgi:hypothetical protein
MKLLLRIHGRALLAEAHLENPVESDSHFTLFLGPYSPPRIPRDQHRFWEMRDLLKVGAWSDGPPIPRWLNGEAKSLCSTRNHQCSAQ